MMITFDLSIIKIFKNSFILALSAMKRNFVGFVGVMAIIIFNWSVLLTYAPFGTLLPIVITCGACIFIEIYTSYPKIKQVMIDPYYESDSPGARPRKRKVDTDAENASSNVVSSVSEADSKKS